MNLSRNTKDVIDSFDDICEKGNCEFIQFDIKEYYPSIREETLDKAIDFAKLFTNINEEVIKITKHCRKTLI